MSDLFQSPEAQQAVLELPFVDSATPGELNFWDIESTGHSDTDVALGEHYAGVALAAARRFGMPVLIAMCLRDMCLAGRFTGVEAGFIASIASAARVGSYN